MQQRPRGVLGHLTFVRVYVTACRQLCRSGSPRHQSFDVAMFRAALETFGGGGHDVRSPCHAKCRRLFCGHGRLRLASKTQDQSQRDRTSEAGNKQPALERRIEDDFSAARFLGWVGSLRGAVLVVSDLLGSRSTSARALFAMASHLERAGLLTVPGRTAFACTRRLNP